MRENSAPKNTPHSRLEAAFVALREPFPESAIRWRIGARSKDNSRGQALPYLDPRAVQERLDEVIGAENWQVSYREIRDGVLCRLEIYCNGEWVAKEDVASYNPVSEEAADERVNRRRDMAVKGAYSDAFRRAAAMWGIGRYLYSFDVLWVDLKDEGRRFAETPQLPAHLLPAEKDAGEELSQEGARGTESFGATTTSNVASGQTRVSAIAASPSSSRASVSMRAAQPEAGVPAPVGTPEQWAALDESDQRMASVLVERIEKGVALHSVDDYLLNGRGKDLPEWLRTALRKLLSEKISDSAAAAATAEVAVA